MALVGFLLTLFTLFFFDAIYSWSLDAGLTWTLSKLIPYLLLSASGFLLAFSGLLRWKVVLRILPMNQLLRRLVRVLVILLPFAVGFIFHPIYEGDFTNEADVVTTTKTYRDFPKAGLVMLAIPDCPYCLEALYTLKQLKKRRPNTTVEMLVCTTDPTLLQLYRQVAGDEISVKSTNNPDDYALLANHRFPTFIFVKDGRPMYRWSNNQFGAPARDWVEEQP